MPRLYRVTRLSWNHYVLEITVQDTICKFVTAFKFASRTKLRRNSTSQKGRTAGSRCVDQQLTLAEVKVWNGMWKERPERTGMA